MKNLKYHFQLWMIPALVLLAGSLWARPMAPESVSLDRLSTEIVWQQVHQLKEGERPRVVLVLGGGGARGLSHIGVLRVLEEERIPIDQIVGISVGALLGSLYSGGVSVDQLESMANEIGWNKLTDYSKVGVMKILLTEELLSTRRMEEYLERHLGKKYFSDLNIPFSCIATDIRSGDRVVFIEGPVALAARASATIPGLFRPVEYRHRALVDGGLTDVLPTDLVPKDDWTVVVGILPRTGFENEEVSSVLTTLVRSIEIQKEVMVEEKKKLADFLIEPDVGSISMMDLAKNKDAIEAGTRETRRRALDLKKLIIKKIIQRKERNIGER
ncbi:hypothetical protein BVX98_06790 [bacterium F11]|nr:hypothetical protein BVX98_06790 [bacterium F11]